MSLAAHGLPDTKIMRAGLALGPIACDRATDRSVLGSMNIAISDLGAHLEGVPNLLALDLAATAVHLNKRPLSVRGVWLYSGKEMVTMVERL